jgi:hypothetical protein
MLSRKLEAAEAEITRLRLRLDGRAVPYYAVLSEFFSSKLEKFIPPDHTCTCKYIALSPFQAIFVAVTYSRSSKQPQKKLSCQFKAQPSFKNLNKLFPSRRQRPLLTIRNFKV